MLNLFLRMTSEGVKMGLEAFDYIAEGQMSLFDYIKTDNAKSEIETLKESEILKGSGFSNGKKRIIQYFNEGHNLQEEAIFLRKEYGVGGWSITKDGKTIGFNDHSASGITLNLSEPIENQGNVYMGWLMVAKYVRELIKEGRYKV